MFGRWTPYLRILLGVALLTTPALWQPGADHATVSHDATEVEYTDDAFQAESGVTTGPIRGLACYVADDSRYCAFEQYVAREGPVTVARTHFATSHSEFVAAGGFYRTVENGSGENVTLDLEPVDAGTVLAELSRPADELSDPALDAIRTGESVTVRVPVDQGVRRAENSVEFVAANDSYYLLHSTATVHDGVESPLETPVKVGLFGLGLLLVLRGQSKRADLDDPPL